MVFRRALSAAALCFLAAIPAARAESGRFFEPAPGYVQAKDLPETFRAAVDSIELDIKDAYEGSDAHSDAERWLFDLGDKLHIESKPRTVRRRLLFRAGDTVSAGLLRETEKALRSEEFLADAVIEAKPNADGTARIKVTTYDQWTTVPGVSLQRLGGEWIYWIGPVESNLLGTGQRLGAFIGHDQFRDTRWIDYNNNALTARRLKLTAHAAWLSDGYSHLFSLSRPLLARSDRYAFSASFSARKAAEWLYFDGNDLDRVSDSLAEAKQGRPNALLRFDRVATDDVNLSVTRSFGYRTKFNVSPTFDYRNRYHPGSTDSLSASLRAAQPLPPSALAPDLRSDALLGVSLSVYQYAHKTVRNFSNLKWNETLETGWRLSTKASANQEWLGARNSDFYLSHALVYNDAWRSSLFLNSGASMRYFLSPAGRFDDGQAALSAETQWKPHPLTSSFLAINWAHLFASERSQQQTLGEESGLNGYPNSYYAGQARFLAEAEQRLFPPFEWGTLVPALAVFTNAGNTFDSYTDFDPSDLHYSVGFGLRLGASKSTQKLVNHINVSFPIGEKFSRGSLWERMQTGFSIRAKKGL